MNLTNSPERDPRDVPQKFRSHQFHGTDQAGKGPRHHPNRGTQKETFGGSMGFIL